MDEDMSENDVGGNEDTSIRIEFDMERNEGAKRLKTDDDSNESTSSINVASVSNAEDKPETTETNEATTSNRCTFRRVQHMKPRQYRNRVIEDDDSRSSTNEVEDPSTNHATLSPSNSIGVVSVESDVESSFPSFTSYATVLQDSESESDGEELELLKKPKPKHTFSVVPAIINRQMGYNTRKQCYDSFQKQFYGCLHCVQRLELMSKLEKHDGCVNSLNFHPDGSLLTSGSDDLKVIIWDWKLGTPLLEFNSKHRNNIFQTKFLPLTGDLHIATCARDGQVRLAQVSAQEGLRSIRKLGSHRRPCHKLAVMQDQPHVILSAGEDGVVLSHDVRSNKPAQIVTVKTNFREIPLYSIHSNPLNSNEFCVSGHDHFVRTYDQRKCGDDSSPLQLYFPNNTEGKYLDLHITCAVYNYNGAEILATYNDGDIYLFDVNSSKGNFAHRYEGHRNGATIKGVNFYGPKSEFIISGSDCGYIYIWEKNTEAIVNWMLGDDSGVVNCLEPHPHFPFLCTSGLDWDIKLWVPSSEYDPTMTGLAEIAKSNTKGKGSYSGRNSNENQMLWILWRHLRGSSARSQRDLPYQIESSNSSSSSSEGLDSNDDDANSINLDSSAGCTTC